MRWSASIGGESLDNLLIAQFKKEVILGVAAMLSLEILYSRDALRDRLEVRLLNLEAFAVPFRYGACHRIHHLRYEVLLEKELLIIVFILLDSCFHG